MQNAGLAALGLNWRYLAFETNPADLRAAIAGAKAMKFIGLNLTVPHKLLALDMVDELDVSAKVWGAVNTIRFEGRTARSGWLPLREFNHDSPVEVRTHGFNTDADAIAVALREDFQMNLRGARVLLLGAGGAGRTAAFKFADAGVLELFLVNRTLVKAFEIVEEIKKKFPRVYVTASYPKAGVDLVVNATSLGLKASDALPFDGQLFSLRSTRMVYDMIYRPAETPLLKAAKAAGCRTANGLGMLLHQGAKALEIWTGQPAPVDVMRRALEKNVYG
ncbi:MAG: shikimate dehydrogenase [Verrucomicrobia bacterium]|nr:shikimate dehydrogenase [Verrucomicrobiota bacterium]